MEKSQIIISEWENDERKSFCLFLFPFVSVGGCVCVGVRTIASIICVLSFGFDIVDRLRSEAISKHRCGGRYRRFSRRKRAAVAVNNFFSLAIQRINKYYQ